MPFWPLMLQIEDELVKFKMDMDDKKLKKYFYNAY